MINVHPDFLPQINWKKNQINFLVSERLFPTKMSKDRVLNNFRDIVEPRRRNNDAVGFMTRHWDPQPAYSLNKRLTTAQIKIVTAKSKKLNQILDEVWIIIILLPSAENLIGHEKICFDLYSAMKMYSRCLSMMKIWPSLLPLPNSLIFGHLRM